MNLLKTLSLSAFILCSSPCLFGQEPNEDQSQQANEALLAAIQRQLTQMITRIDALEARIDEDLLIASLARTHITTNNQSQERNS